MIPVRIGCLLLTNMLKFLQTFTWGDNLSHRRGVRKTKPVGFGFEDGKSDAFLQEQPWVLAACLGADGGLVLEQADRSVRDAAHVSFWEGLHQGETWIISSVCEFWVFYLLPFEVLSIQGWSVFGFGSCSRSRSCWLCWINISHQMTVPRWGPFKSVNCWWGFGIVIDMNWITEAIKDCHWHNWYWLITTHEPEWSWTILECRKALDNHETYRQHFGGRIFTAEGVFSEKVPDGQPWIACNLP